MSVIGFVQSPWVLWLRRMQFFVGIGVYITFALMPNPPVEGVTQDKYLHFLGNLVLYASSYVAWADRCKAPVLLALLVPFCVLVEGLQAFTPNRMLDEKDMLANVLGLCVGFCLAQACAFAARKGHLINVKPPL